MIRMLTVGAIVAVLAGMTACTDLDTASSAAQAAQQRCDALTAKIDRMFKKSLSK